MRNGREMNRSCDSPGTLLAILAVTFLLAGIFGIGVFFAPAAEEGPDCDIQSGSCAYETADGMRIEFDVQPKPVTSMSDLTFIVTVTRGGSPVSDASVALNLSMPGMFMGKNQPVLKHAENGRYEGKGVIIKCPSGRKIWQADIAIARGGMNASARFVFEVK